MIIDTAGKTVIRFITKEIDSKIEHIGEGWTKSKRILLFEFDLFSDRVALRLYIGPGDDDYRKKLQEFFFKDKKLFKLADRKFGTKHHAVYNKDFLRKKDFEEDDSEARMQKLGKKYDEFISNDLPLMHKHFQTHWVK